MIQFFKTPQSFSFESVKKIAAKLQKAFFKMHSQPLGLIQGLGASTSKLRPGTHKALLAG